MGRGHGHVDTWYVKGPVLSCFSHVLSLYVSSAELRELSSLVWRKQREMEHKMVTIMTDVRETIFDP